MTFPEVEDPGEGCAAPSKRRHHQAPGGFCQARAPIASGKVSAPTNNENCWPTILANTPIISCLAGLTSWQGRR
jgi:hypothetical protein